MSILISCEHAGRDVPEDYHTIFADHLPALNSHRGWDPGAWEVARHLSAKLDVPCFGCHTTRLLIEVNRSLHHPQLFSEFSGRLNDVQKDKLIREIYLNYRNTVEEFIESSDEPVLHLSIHSFTPVFDNVVRELEIGLLFDPDRPGETAFCQELCALLSKTIPGHQVKFNEPYKGVDDGFTTYLRTRFKNDSYKGIEVEINQKLLNSPEWEMTKEALAASLMPYRFS